MKKILFVILSIFMLVGSVNAESKVTSYYTITNKCAVVKDNKAVIPVIVKVDNAELKLSKLLEEIKIDYITNYKDVLNLNIYDVNKEYIDVYVDYNRTKEGKSLIYFSIEEDLELKRHDELVSFNIGVEILSDYEINKMDVFGNEVLLSDEKTCEEINGFKVTEVEKIKYIDLSKADHKEYFEDLISNFIIMVLTISLIVCIVLLVRKKK